MKKIELLSPAGNMECLIAAANAGADAIYIGGDKFSARAKAENFTKEKIIEGIDYLKIYNIKLYVALNTLIKDEEMEEAIEYAKFLYSVGVDALIIQDIGLFKNLRKICPEIELHASTQMTIHNIEGAKLLKEIGFKRVVLSRELSLKEIEEISKEVETEIFIHGALCISYSGACLLSSLIGGNSGNRGRCSQPCRLPYKIEGREGYLLSPKDLCTLNNIEDIINTGTASLKIEGRMKSITYVAATVSAYRKAIDNVLKGSKEELGESYNDLLKVFNREGFSKAYLYGNTGKEMMAYKFPRNSGVILGRAVTGGVLLEDDLSSRDGIRIENTGFNVEKIFVKGKEAALRQAHKGDIVKIIPNDYKYGDILFKTYDYNIEKKMSEFGEKYLRKINIPLEVIFKKGENLTLIGRYNDTLVKIQGEIVEEAKNIPISKERIIETLSKSNETPIRFEPIDFISYEEGFLKIADLNQGRRDLILKLEESIKKIEIPSPKYLTKSKYSIEVSTQKYDNMEEEIICVASNEDQVRAIQEFKGVTLGLNPFLFPIDIKGIDSFILKLPTVIKEEFNEIIDYIEKNIDKIKGIITSNLGIIRYIRGKIKIYGDYKLNILNNDSLDFYKELGIVPTLSLELNKKELENINNSYSFLIYGRGEVMISEYNMIKSLGIGEEKKIFKLKDRKGEEFPLVIDNYGRTNIFNSHILNLIESKSEIKKIKGKTIRLDFLEESFEETRLILNSLINESKNKNIKNIEGKYDTKYTKGHFKRGVL